MHPALSNRDFVNINGEPWRPSFDAVNAKVRPKKDGPGEYHKGWRVEGLPPGSAADARELFLAEVGVAEAGKRPAPIWDEKKYLSKLKTKAVRAKPYEISDSAVQCKELAERAGWLRVVVRELKRAA